METARQLLSAALDPAGHICVIGLRPKRAPIQKFFEPGDIDGAIAEAEKLAAAKMNPYFATSTFKSGDNRRADNVYSVRVLKLDVDSGDNKEYKTKKEAIAALMDFCTVADLPTPVTVDSGNGIHAYWPMDVSMQPAQAKLMSEKLKTLCHVHKLYADPTTTSDLARILRIPGTMNLKDEDNPKEVKVRGKVFTYTQDEVLSAFDAAYSKVAKDIQTEVKAADTLFALPAYLKGMDIDDATRRLVGGKPKQFALIVERGETGTGCAQLKDINSNRAVMDEPRWRAGLSIAKFCEDGELWTQNISKDHPSYDPIATQRKAELIVGPYTCATFNGNWPELCKGCKLQGNITSPIQLGEYTPKATAADNMILDRNKLVEDEPVVYTIPTYPEPYFRGKDGGIFLPNTKDDEAGDIQVYNRDFYMVRRLREETDGYMVQCRVHHPKDGAIDFIMSVEDISAPDRLRDILNRNGMFMYEKEIIQMRSYVRRWYETLEKELEVDMVKTQFGWNDSKTSFTIGSREVTAHNSYKYSPSAPSLAPLTKFFGQEGTLEEWRKIVDSYALPNHETQAFSFLCGFGSPLLPFTGLSGAQVNLVSEASGTGKSTSQMAALSIWGDPKALLLSYGDTQASIINRMGVHNNIVVCIDEATNAPVERIKAFAMAVTQGRGSNRMNSASNTERANNTTWSMIAVSSSNSSMIEMLQAQGQGTQGEQYRIIEMTVPPVTALTKLEADRLYPHLLTNYGLAGPLFAKYIVENRDHVKHMVAVEQEALDRDGRFTGRERFWSAAFACVLVGGQIASQEGLHGIDMEKMRAWILKYVERMRVGITGHASGTEGEIAEADENVLAEFINSNITNILVIDEVKDPRTGLHAPPVQTPRNELMARYELGCKRLFIPTAVFKKFCRERNIHVEAYLNRQKEAGIFITNDVKRLSAGTAIPQKPARAYWFNVKDGIDDAIAAADAPK